jgi:predicted amidohydrolase YtcJ
VRRSPDLILLGRIASLAGETGFGWIGGLAVIDGRIVASGSRHEIRLLAGARTRIIDLSAGQIALPAVTDAHLHLVAAALAAEEVDLEGAPSLAAALALVAEAHAVRLSTGDPACWLFGHGWATDGWQGRPSAADLERVAPGRPIALWAHDHHTRWLSEAALAAMGIDATTIDPPGGSIGRDPSGRPDGLVHEHATRIGADAIPRPTEVAIEAAIARYAERLAGLGVTGVHDPGGLAPDASLAGGLGTIRAMAAAGRLPIRVHAGLRDEQLDTAISTGLRSGQGLAPDQDSDVDARRAIDRFRVGWLKLFSDGSVGSRTAAMLEPYDDARERPGPAGPLGGLLETREQLSERVSRAARAGIATMIHAIGDRAVRTALDAFDGVGAARLAKLPLMPRIEHAQFVHPDDRPRFARLGVVASMQPVQLRSDEATMRGACRDRTSLAFAMASLSASGATIALGTDAPVEPPDPWPGIAMAVTRQAPEWGPEAPASSPQEAIALEQAIRAATVGPHRAAGEVVGGRLVSGAPADLVVLKLAAGAEPADPAAVAELTDDAAEALYIARPLLTLLDGQERHRAPGFDR